MYIVSGMELLFEIPAYNHIIIIMVSLNKDVKFNNQVVGQIIEVHSDNTVVIDIHEDYAEYFISKNQPIMVSTRGEKNGKIT